MRKDEIRNENGQEFAVVRIADETRENRLKWFGCVMRREEESRAQREVVVVKMNVYKKGRGTRKLKNLGRI